MKTDLMSYRFSLSVEGMHCGACVGAVEKALLSVEGVERAQANLATERVVVVVRDPAVLRSLQDAVTGAGYRLKEISVSFLISPPLSEEDRQSLDDLQGVLSVEAVPLRESQSGWRVRMLDGVATGRRVIGWLKERGYEVHPVEEAAPRSGRENPQRTWLISWLGLGISFVIMALTMIPPFHHLVWARWLSLVLATVVLIVVGTPFFDRAVRSALKLQSSMDTLVSLGALSAYLYSVWGLVVGSEHLYFDSSSFILSAISLGKSLE
ncbi:MAG: cation transporter, partial [Armatimonadetes bacterium]|nr:cation transporter [Armatimonadota bacterium]